LSRAGKTESMTEDSARSSTNPFKISGMRLRRTIGRKDSRGKCIITYVFSYILAKEWRKAKSPPRRSEPRPQQETPEETDEYMAENEETLRQAQGKETRELFSGEQRREDPYREKAE